jgi:hypothetical protein
MCEIQVVKPLEGFDKTQEEKLRSRKREVTKLSEIEKWKMVYKILFPDDEEAAMPSPCKFDIDHQILEG